MKITELLKALRCPRCKKDLKIIERTLVCPSCRGKVISDGERFLDFRTLAPEIPLHFAEYTQNLHELAGQTMPDVPIDWRVNAVIDEVKKLGSGDACLEIGGADGMMTEKLESLYKTFLSLDFGKSFLKRVEAKTKKAICLCSDAHFLPLQDHSINLVICSEVLEHTSIPTQIMLEIRRVLVKNGKCILSVPNEDTWNNLFLRRKYKQLPAGDSHITFYTATTLRKFLFRMGFEIIQFRYLSQPLVSIITPLRLISFLKGKLIPQYLLCLIQPMKYPDIYWESLARVLGYEMTHGILEKEQKIS